jgi:hypothetical protein
VRHPSRWTTEAVRSDQLIVVWPQHSRSTIGPDVPELVRNIAYRPLARALGVDVRELQSARSDEAMTAALDGTQIIAAVVSRDGMRLVVPLAVSAPEEVEKIVRLGVKLARTRQAHPVF